MKRSHICGCRLLFPGQSNKTFSAIIISQNKPSVDAELIALLMAASLTTGMVTELL